LIAAAAGGLGLARLARGLVDLHGGSVQASSGPGRGSAFTVRLPLEDEPAGKPASGVAALECLPRRILVIEDNVDAACSLRLLLDAGGHRAAVAYSAAAGLAKAREFRPEIIVCDIGLPGGMDGYGFARAARQDPALKDAYLIAMTGYGQEEDRRRAREAGFDVHLVKPADPQVLERLIPNARSG
jgi:CheY-like chemotaxis protein